MVKSLLIVNLRGMVNTPYPVKKTLVDLGLSQKYRATIIPESPSYMGMLNKLKEHIAWCTVEPTFLKELLEKRARKEGWKPLTNDDLLKYGFKNFEEMAQALSDGRIKLNSLEGLKRSFALAPPRGGFKRSIRRMYTQGGLLGKNPDLQKIVRTML